MKNAKTNTSNATSKVENVETSKGNSTNEVKLRAEKQAKVIGEGVSGKKLKKEKTIKVGRIKLSEKELIDAINTWILSNPPVPHLERVKRTIDRLEGRIVRDKVQELNDNYYKLGRVIDHLEGAKVEIPVDLTLQLLKLENELIELGAISKTTTKTGRKDNWRIPTVKKEKSKVETEA